MNIVVLMKQTVDTEAKIVLNNQGKIDTNGVTLVINPLDEYAIEEALRIKEKFGGEVTIVTLGGDQATAAIRSALAMGADKALHINDPALGEVDEGMAATILAQAVKTLTYDIILAGVMDTDNGSAQVAVRMAEKMELPSLSSITKLDIEESLATAKRVIDGGLATLEVTLPAVITVVQGINEVRYPSVAGIMKAKKKPLTVLKLSDLGLDPSNLTAQAKVLKFTLPIPRQGGKKLPGEAAEAASLLARLLREEAKVL
ncbi:electron transfer flavoprotein, beta subunit [Desulfitobacterium dichloroeliminans LMG P-21439]|uniref:Electron transfer flavoprotein subunit beta n=1 Tax=Desulfitobacterium dichloroeliminans (strain LMG P-21439 / DCA1) TaxID=871963 RepID=L0F6G3_DESDL|nr:electron transfer flavoprotein subunit beta/FixA family protein [Desulfitobacterium dichloroeliminans]AGA69429.1 electron transfer flavoprotein, beta subunit [Desulfitobacterium dichloroeliminans LMG P-21439]